ncbi:trichohyalin, partial [Trypanosoma cruzi]
MLQLIVENPSSLSYTSRHFNGNHVKQTQNTVYTTPESPSITPARRRRRAMQDKLDKEHSIHLERVQQMVKQIRNQKTIAVKWQEQERERRAKEAEEAKRQLEQELKAQQEAREAEERRRAELAKQQREESRARKEELQRKQAEERRKKKEELQAETERLLAEARSAEEGEKKALAEKVRT